MFCSAGAATTSSMPATAGSTGSMVARGPTRPSSTGSSTRWSAWSSVEASRFSPSLIPYGGISDDGRRDQTDRADPPRSRRDDVRVVRFAHRTEPERAAKRRGDGQPRHRPGGGALRSRRRVGRRPRGHGRGRGLRGGAGVRARALARRFGCAAAPPRRCGHPERAGRPARDGDAAAVRGLGVGRVRAFDAGRPLGRLAVPSRRLPGGAPPAPRRWTR